MAEQRYQAVLAVIRDGHSVLEVAQFVGVSRQSLHAWLVRYEAEGLRDWRIGRIGRPRVRHQVPGSVEALVLEMRRADRLWGPRRIRHELGRRGVSPLPSESAVYRALVRGGLIEPTGRRRRAERWRRWERGSPMELWQFDVVGGFLLGDGSQAKALTGIDDHSRFCVSALLSQPRGPGRSGAGSSRFTTCSPFASGQRARAERGGSSCRKDCVSLATAPRPSGFESASR